MGIRNDIDFHDGVPSEFAVDILGDERDETAELFWLGGEDEGGDDALGGQPSLLLLSHGLSVLHGLDREGRFKTIGDFVHFLGVPPDRVWKAIGLNTPWMYTWRTDKPLVDREIEVDGV